MTRIAQAGILPVRFGNLIHIIGNKWGLSEVRVLYVTLDIENRPLERVQRPNFDLAEPACALAGSACPCARR